MHGSVCLFSRYLQHLLEGENLEELDITSASSSNNIFRNKNTLSTNWPGTCVILLYVKMIKTELDTELSSLSSIISSEHQKTLDEYDLTTDLIDNIFYTSFITNERPSGLKEQLIPIFEYQFSDKTNISLIGGQIYHDFTYKLAPYIVELEGNILNEIISLINSKTFKSYIDDTYTNFFNFDTTVATASNIMNNKILDLKDYFLTLQFLLMLFTWGYLIFFVILIVLYICYVTKKFEILYYVIFVTVNILFVMMLLEIFLSSFFGQVRLICHEVPRAMNFVFTGTYMVSGNTESYPAQFGKGNINMTKMFNNCLNEDQDLLSLFLPSDFLNVLSSLETKLDDLQKLINDIIDKSNIITNEYNSIENSIFLKAIIQFKLMQENLFFASMGFGEDDIHKILSKIRKNLDNCGMTNEYYVLRESDCPPGSIISTIIYDIPGVIHCYIIQKLSYGSIASYSATGCDNNYINKAINFIKEINDLLETRLLALENLQYHYSLSFENLKNEIKSFSETLKLHYSMIYNIINIAKNSSNCGSTRFDLIDFSDFIGDTTEYDARIIVIFSAFLGVFGFVLLFSFLVVINGLTERDDYDDDIENEFRSYSKKNIRNNKNKKRKTYNSKYYDSEEEDEDEDEEEDNEDNYKRKKQNKKVVKPQRKSSKKVEMSILSKNNESDSS